MKEYLINLIPGLEFKEYKMKYCKIKIFCFAFCPNFHQFKIMNIFI